MSYAVKIGSTEARWIDDLPTPTGHVRFDGELVDLEMVWDDLLQNIRRINKTEQDNRAAAEATLAAEQQQAQIDRAALRTQYQSDLDALQAIRDFSGTVTLAIVGQGLKTLAVVLIHILKALKAIV